MADTATARTHGRVCWRVLDLTDEFLVFGRLAKEAAEAYLTLLAALNADPTDERVAAMADAQFEVTIAYERSALDALDELEWALDPDAEPLRGA